MAITNPVECPTINAFSNFQEEMKYRSEHPEEFPISAVRRQSDGNNFEEMQKKNFPSQQKDNRIKNNLKSNVSAVNSAAAPSAGSSSKTRNTQNRKRNSLLHKSSTSIQAPASHQDDDVPDEDWRSEFECPVCLEQIRL